jgi:hypothetical protein
MEDEIDRIPRVCKFLFPIASINIIAESNRSAIRCALSTMDQFIESCRGRKCFQSNCLLWIDKVRVMVYNATLNNNLVISWWSVLLVEETGVPEENHQLVASLYYLSTMDQFIERCRGRDRMVVGFLTTCATSAYHH